MKVLFDQGTPAPLRKALTAHVVVTVYEKGWSQLQNGQLIAAAELESFDVLVTTDSNLKYQQNLKDRRIAILVLLTTSWPRIQRHLPLVLAALSELSAKSYVEVVFPADS